MTLEKKFCLTLALGLSLSLAMGLVTKAWPAENPAQKIALPLPNYKSWETTNIIEWQDSETGTKKKNIFFYERPDVSITSVVLEYYEGNVAKPKIVIWFDVKYDNGNMAIQGIFREYSLSDNTYLIVSESEIICFQKALCKR